MKALVTGGGGFLGTAIVKHLVDRGNSVRSFHRRSYRHLAELGVEQCLGDLADATAVSDAVRGCDAVLHVAAKAGVWGPFQEYFATNVTGTTNVITACREHAIPKLVYTSTPSVVHTGGDIHGGDERLPYADEFETAYPHTKAEAERLVLQANSERLATVALRPHLIWGPGDTQLVPRLVERQRQGRLRLVGPGDNLVDSVYIDSAAQAHLCAVDRLSPSAACAGKAYFITQGEPWPIAKLINGILVAAGLPPVTKHISVASAVRIGWLMETIWGTLHIRREPPMTRFVARQLATSHYFDITNARRDLGYEPSLSIEEGLKRLEQWLRTSNEER